MGHQYSVGYILRDEIGNVIGWYGAKTYTFSRRRSNGHSMGAMLFVDIYEFY